MPLHILLPLQDAELGYYFDKAIQNHQDGSTAEDRLRAVGRDLLGIAFSPDFGWRIDGQPVYITKPTSLEISHKNRLPRTLYEHRDTFSLKLGRQVIGDGATVYIVDLLENIGNHMPDHDQLAEQRAKRWGWTKGRIFSKIG